MRRAPHPEPINIVHEALGLGIQRRIHGPHARGQHGGVVDALGAGDNFLPAHEGVVGVGQGGVGRGEVRVEGAGGGGVVG